MDQPAHVTAITGASRGIGAAVARRLAAEGHGVVIGYRSDRDAAVAAGADVAELGGAASVARVDVTDAASLTAFLDSAAELGPLTGVVASAGAVRAVGNLSQLNTDDLRRDIEVNLLGAVLTAQAAIVHLERTRGSLVFVGSAAATLGSPNTYVHYAAAKAGVSALSLGLSKELAPLGVRVNCVEPGHHPNRVPPRPRPAGEAGADDPSRVPRRLRSRPPWRNSVRTVTAIRNIRAMTRTPHCACTPRWPALRKPSKRGRPKRPTGITTSPAACRADSVAKKNAAIVAAKARIAVTVARIATAIGGSWRRRALRRIIAPSFRLVCAP